MTRQDQNSIATDCDAAWAAFYAITESGAATEQQVADTRARAYRASDAEHAAGADGERLDEVA